MQNSDPHRGLYFAFCGAQRLLQNAMALSGHGLVVLEHFGVREHVQFTLLVLSSQSFGTACSFTEIGVSMNTRIGSGFAYETRLYDYYGRPTYWESGADLETAPAVHHSGSHP